MPEVTCVANYKHISQKAVEQIARDRLKFNEKYVLCNVVSAHSQVHNDRTVPIIMAGCIAHARNGRISTSGLKYDVTIVFLDPDFL